MSSPSPHGFNLSYLLNFPLLAPILTVFPSSQSEILMNSAKLFTISQLTGHQRAERLPHLRSDNPRFLISCGPREIEEVGYVIYKMAFPAVAEAGG